MDYKVFEIKTITTGFIVRNKSEKELNEFIKELRNDDKKINPLWIENQEIQKTYLWGGTNPNEDYITDLEEENENLTEQNRLLTERIKSNGNQEV